MPKTYGQFCAAARALDHVGDRWTLLIIRELLLGQASYGDLAASLDGIPTNLLADRLRDLEGHGMVVREESDRDRRRVVYRLTPLGAGLEPVLFELIRWGSHWMQAGPGADRFDPRWTLLAVRALLDRRVTGRAGTVLVRTDDTALTIVSTGTGPVLVDGDADPDAQPDATAQGDPEILLALLSGQMTLAGARRKGLVVRGDAALVSALLVPSQA